MGVVKKPRKRQEKIGPTIIPLEMGNPPEHSSHRQGSNFRTSSRHDSSMTLVCFLDLTIFCDDDRKR